MESLSEFGSEPKRERLELDSVSDSDSDSDSGLGIRDSTSVYTWKSTPSGVLPIVASPLLLSCG